MITALVKIIAHGVLQVSVLGPLLFIMYNADISCIVNGHQPMCLCYADHTRVFFHMKVGKLPVVKGMIEDYISHIAVGLQAVGYDSMRARRKYCGVHRREEQVH